MTHCIVVIEDDQAIAQMYRIKFEGEGCRVETARNGVLGLELVEKIKPHAILLDLMMPEMNGDEMLKQLRQTDWGKGIKVIILTNVGEQEIPASINELEVAAVVQKADHTPSEVVKMVKDILEH